MKITPEHININAHYIKQTIFYVFHVTVSKINILLGIL